MYLAIDNQVYYLHRCGDRDERAICNSAADAKEAAALLNHAGHLNNVRRQYTAAARTIAKAESIAGFRWNDGI